MPYHVTIRRGAQRALGQLPTSAYERVRDAIRALAQNPYPQGGLRLSGRDGWRNRVGDFRVIYEIDSDKQAITILHVGHRRDVYR